jgi:transcriptional regulator with XRE-family HTH domain
VRKLKRLRAEKGLTMDALEERTGVSKRTISEIERGMRAPQALTLAKLAGALGVDMGELHEEETPKVSSRLSSEKAPEEASEEERREREREEDLVAVVARWAKPYAERCIEEGEKLELRLSSLENAVPVSADSFYTQLNELNLVYDELSGKGQIPEEFEDLKQRLDEIASRIDAQVKRVMSPSEPACNLRGIDTNQRAEGRRREAEHKDATA